MDEDGIDRDSSQRDMTPGATVALQTMASTGGGCSGTGSQTSTPTSSSSSLPGSNSSSKIRKAGGSKPELAKDETDKNEPTPLRKGKWTVSSVSCAEDL